MEELWEVEMVDLGGVGTAEAAGWRMDTGVVEAMVEGVLGLDMEA